MKNPFSPALLREKLRELLRAIRSLANRDLSPERAARSVAIGLFVGSSPFYGFHFPICAALAYLLRLDLLVTYVVTNISIAPVIPFLVFLEVQIGFRILEGRWLSIRFEDFSLEQAQRMGSSLFAGAFVVGTALALVGGFLTWSIARSWQGRKVRQSEKGLALALAEVKELYKGVKPAHRHYVHAKLRMDPLSSELFHLVQRVGTLGRVVDAGCGRGQFSLLLSKLGAVQSLFGFDHDEDKIFAARKAAEELSGVRVTFVTGDLRTTDCPAADTVLLLDVLHYVSFEEQSLLLERSRALLGPGGRLIIRETNHQGGLAPVFASFLERLAKLFRVNRGEQLAFRAPGLLEAELRDLGMLVMRHAPKGALKNVLLEAQVPAETLQEQTLLDRL